MVNRPNIHFLFAPMSRPVRIQYPGATYHIIARGNSGLNIFLDDKDYQSFLAVFFDCIETFNLICCAWCRIITIFYSKDRICWNYSVKVVK